MSAFSMLEYQQAYKLGMKEIKSLEAKGKYPHLTSLEEKLPRIDSMSTDELGVVSIPLDRIVGTKTASRSDAFSRSFYPVMPFSSEFCTKWVNLAESIESEGMHEPIKVVEYMHQYYVVDGNKRVSVMRALKGAYIDADVTRIIPARTEAPDNVAYFEFLDFFKTTGINNIYFHKPGRYAELLKLLGMEKPEDWDLTSRRSFNANMTWFRNAYSKVHFRTLEPDEAMLRCLQIFGYEYLKGLSASELINALENIEAELLRPTGEDSALLLEPDEGKTSKFFDFFTRKGHEGVLRIAMLHDKDCDSSPWTEAHELGLSYVQGIFGDRLEALSCFNMVTGNAEERLEQLASAGYHMIFTTSPKLLGATLTAAAKHPGTKFLNCSLNIGSPMVRSYYARMHEATFLTGMIAGALAPDGKIGYVCSYPIVGMPAAINAFALGAQMTNPEAKIYLEWTSVAGNDIQKNLKEKGVSIALGEDIFTPNGADPDAGLYIMRDGKRKLGAQTVCVWGKFYERIIRSVFDGTWNDLSSSVRESAINYWWGLSSGMINLIYKTTVPAGTKRLVDLLIQEMSAGRFVPFEGPVYDNRGELRLDAGETLEPMEIVKMNWLASNVVGSIPKAEELSPEARALVLLQGIDMDS